MAAKHGKKRDSLVQYLSELRELSIDFGGDLKERVDFEIQKSKEDGNKSFETVVAEAV